MGRSGAHLSEQIAPPKKDARFLRPTSTAGSFRSTGRKQAGRRLGRPPAYVARSLTQMPSTVFATEPCPWPAGKAAGAEIPLVDVTIVIIRISIAERGGGDRARCSDRGPCDSGRGVRSGANRSLVVAPVRVTVV